MSLTAEQALDHWEEKGLLTAKKAAELRSNLHTDKDIPNKALAIFSGIGAILVGLGVILFVSSNWDAMSPTLKVILLVAGILSTGFGGYYLQYEKDYEKTGTGLLFVNVLIFGASIFLVAQIYHLQLTFWWGALLWLLGTAYMAYVLSSRMHIWLSVPLLILFLGWLRTSYLGFGRDELDFLFDDRSAFWSLAPVIGIGLMGLSILHRKAKSMTFATPTLFHWGIFLVMFLLVIATVDKSFYFHMLHVQSDPITIGIVAVSVMLLAAALLTGQFATKNGRVGLLACTLYVFFVYLITYIPGWMGLDVGVLRYYGSSELRLDMVSGLFILYVLLTFFFLLLTVWFGTLLRDPPVINLGMLGVAAVIFIQYFSWAFELLPRSLFFIIGGLVILGFTSVLERKRRQLIASIKPSRA